MYFDNESESKDQSFKWRGPVTNKAYLSSSLLLMLIMPHRLYDVYL